MIQDMDCVFKSFAAADKRRNVFLSSSCIQFFVLICTVYSALGELVKECPNNFPTDCGEQCYKLVNTAKNWRDARTECQRLGGDLAVIRNKDEQVCASNQHNTTAFTHDDAHYWIGLYIDPSATVTNADQWKWVDSPTSVGPNSYRNWAIAGNDREPNAGSERCGEMVYATQYRVFRSGAVSVNSWGMWNNAECGSNIHYICGKRKATIESKCVDMIEHAGSGQLTCDKGYVVHIEKAVWGANCKTPVPGCPNPVDVTDLVKVTCHHFESCSIIPSVVNFSDPCLKVKKTLAITYKCTSESTARK